jgi:DNA-binding IclR family transcriptional regulator
LEETPPKPKKASAINSTVTSLEKALLILELAIDEGRNLAVTDISRKLGMGKGTVHRILTTLRARRFFYQDKSTKLYGLGSRTLEIGMASKRDKYLRNAMAPFLMDLHEQCKETVNAAVWEYNEIRYIYRIESEEMLRISASAGSRFPGYCAATGKIFLSYMSDEDLRQIYGRKTALKKRTENSIDSIDALIQEIEKVRVRRIAVDDEESLVGVYCVAAPILAPNGECVAAISISAPKNRAGVKVGELFAELVTKAARSISDSFSEP